MNVMTPVRDEGTAYEMPSSTYKAALTEVRRGMPMGELLRRYWHPVAVSADASSTPRRVKALGESHSISRRGGQARPRPFALRASRHDALLWEGGRAWHTLLLSRLAF